ncbi:hypothetical protein D6789_00140 [Candidatus Woesearchaeota archaeon]|nr:MAG: hypothetical protein D6789_00140 [Candidatus Woesearchaeota archaeon]
MLGDLEKDHLAALRKLQRANARAVWETLSKDRVIAYTTVSTTLDRLYKKGYVGRDVQEKRGGKNYVYHFKNLRARFANQLLDEFVHIFGNEAINTFVQEAKKR